MEMCLVCFRNTAILLSFAVIYTYLADAYSMLLYLFPNNL